MRVSVLASGSNGNATCIKTTNESFLIDDGLSFKMLYARMEETNNDIHNLSSIKKLSLVVLMQVAFPLEPLANTDTLIKIHRVYSSKKN